MIELIASWVGASHPALAWTDVLLSVVGLFALVSTKTANTTDDRIAQVLLDVVNFLGGNFGKAKNVA